MKIELTQKDLKETVEFVQLLEDLHRLHHYGVDEIVLCGTSPNVSIKRTSPAVPTSLDVAKREVFQLWSQAVPELIARSKEILESHMAFNVKLTKHSSLDNIDEAFV